MNTLDNDCLNKILKLSEFDCLNVCLRWNKIIKQNIKICLTCNNIIKIYDTTLLETKKGNKLCHTKMVKHKIANVKIKENVHMLLESLNSIIQYDRIIHFNFVKKTNTSENYLKINILNGDILVSFTLEQNAFDIFICDTDEKNIKLYSDILKKFIRPKLNGSHYRKCVLSFCVIQKNKILLNKDYFVIYKEKLFSMITDYESQSDKINITIY